MTTEEFNRCLQLIKSGNNCGMKAIYDCYYEKLLFSVRLEVNNRYIAEDIVSNLLISIFKNAANYSYIKSPNSWMYRAATFAIINYKKNNQKYIFAEFIDETYSANDAGMDIKIELRRAVDMLPKRQQRIVELHFLYGITIHETAKMLKISASTVKRDILELRERIKKIL